MTGAWHWSVQKHVVLMLSGPGGWRAVVFAAVVLGTQAQNGGW